MRVLLGIMPSPTHLHPYVPLVWALQGAGHDVRIASYPDMTSTITDAGLLAVGLGDPVDLSAAVQRCAADVRFNHIIDPLAVGSADPELWKLIRLYLMSPFWLHYAAEPAEGTRPIVNDLVDFARSWQPDLVVWDPMFFPAAVAARAVGAAHVRMLWGPDYFAWTRQAYRRALSDPDSGVETDLMSELMMPTLARFGMEFDEELLIGAHTVDPMPPSMRLPVDIRYLPVRRVPFTGVGTLPDWLREPAKRQRVCLSLGVSTRQHFDKNRGLPMADLLEMVADLDVELVATLNADQLASVARVPDNVRLIDYVPLNLLLPTCSAIIHHGGGGTFAAAVAHRVPQLVTARTSGQSADVARFVEERGAGLVGPDIDSPQFSADVVKEKLVSILADPSFRAGAAVLHAEMAAMPSPHDLVPQLEELAERAAT